jgi:hypothetical protein
MDSDVSVLPAIFRAIGLGIIIGVSARLLPPAGVAGVAAALIYLALRFR